MEDLWRIRHKLAIKDHSTGPWADGIRRQAMNPDGTVGVDCSCGHWDIESDKFHNCRDQECRRERLIKALYSGEAMMTSDGDIIWCHGVVIRKE